jgi:hypothetical protein
LAALFPDYFATYLEDVAPRKPARQITSNRIRERLQDFEGEAHSLYALLYSELKMDHDAVRTLEDMQITIQEEEIHLSGPTPTPESGHKVTKAAGRMTDRRVTSDFHP